MENYDPKSGQVFKETIVPAARLSRPSAQPQVFNPKYEAPAKGVETLRTKALREIVRSAHSLSSEALAAIPASMVQQIWKALTPELDLSENKMSLWAFKMFADSGHKDFSAQTHLVERMPGYFSKPITDCLADITSSSFAWVAMLSLATATSTAADLKQLIALINLQSLEIRCRGEDDKSEFDDGIVKYWASRANTNGAFPRLRLLMIVNAPHITTHTLMRLNDFPALEGFLLAWPCLNRNGKAYKAFGEKYGWYSDLKGGFSDYLQEDSQNGFRRKAHLNYHRLITVVDDYISSNHRRNAQSASLPKLQVRFDEFCPVVNAHRAINFSKFLFLERRKSVMDGQSEPNPTSSAEDGGPASKKRKVKEGKQVALDRFLEDL